MNCARRKQKNLGLLACWAVLGASVACAQPEQDFDDGPARKAGGGRGGAAAGGRSGAGGTAASAGSTARGGSTAVSRGGTGAGGETIGNGGTDEPPGSAGQDGSDAGGAGGTDGTGGAPLGSGGCAPSPTARVQYKVVRSDSVIQFQLRFYNESATALALSQYEIDYYLSNDEDSVWNTYVDDASTNGGADGYVGLQGVTSVSMEPLVPQATGATHVVRITIDSTAPLEALDVGLLSIRLEPTSYEPPHQVQTDDYSFDLAKTDFADSDKVTLLAQSDLLWGCQP